MEGGRRGEAVQRRAPECLGCVEILVLQPGDVIAIGARPRKPQLPLLDEFGIGGKDLVEDQRQRPAIEQQVVMAPDEYVPIRRLAEERQIHQRCLGQHKSTAALVVEEAREAGVLLIRRQFTPILDGPRNLYVRPY